MRPVFSGRVALRWLIGGRTGRGLGGVDDVVIEGEYAESEQVDISRGLLEKDEVY